MSQESCTTTNWTMPHLPTGMVFCAFKYEVWIPRVRLPMCSCVFLNATLSAFFPRSVSCLPEVGVCERVRAYVFTRMDICHLGQISSGIHGNHRLPSNLMSA